MRTIVSTAVQCVKMALSLLFAGLMGVISMIAMIHLYEENLRMYAAIAGVVMIGVFVYLTTAFAKRSDKEGLV